MFGKTNKESRRIKLPFESTDEKPYIFVSYGHDDKEKVFPMLRTLYEAGFNVWYDEGIAIGEKYDEVIESHIRGSAVFLLFASSLSLSRPYVLDVELKIASEIRDKTPFLSLFIEKGVTVPDSAKELLSGSECYLLDEVIRRLASLGIQNFGKRKARPVEREVPQYWFDSYDPEPAGESGGIVWSAEEPYACLAFHPDDVTVCNPYAKELFFAGYNVRSCENLGDKEREKMITAKGCGAYVPFVTKKYVESGQLERDYRAATKAGKPMIALYIRAKGSDGAEESFSIPSAIVDEFSRLQGLDCRELTDNDFLSKLEAELEKRKCFASAEKGRVTRRSFEIKDFLYDFTDGGRKLILTRYRGEKEASALSVRRSYFGFPVAGIGEQSFRYCTWLKEVKLPEGLENIGNEAFFSCDSLQSVNIPVTVKSIGEYSFSKCGSLLSVDLPEGIANIPKGAFEDCDSLTEFIIPEGVAEIGNSAFSQCSELISVSIPESVRSIGDTAFYDCVSLRSAELPDSVSGMGDGVFIGCQSLAYVKFSAGMPGTGSENFRECGSLRKIMLPEGLTVIDDYAFYGCDGLEEISIPDSVLSIGAYAFADCDNLKHLTLPAGVSEIGDHAFDNCLALSEVTVLSGDTEIGEGALDDCDLVRCPEDSQVWEYCEENGIDCEPL